MFEAKEARERLYAAALRVYVAHQPQSRKPLMPVAGVRGPGTWQDPDGYEFVGVWAGGYNLPSSHDTVGARRRPECGSDECVAERAEVAELVDAQR